MPISDLIKLSRISAISRKREPALVELAVAQPFVDQVADQPFEPRGRWVGKGPAGTLDRVGDHQDGGLAGLRLGTRIAIGAFRHG